MISMKRTLILTSALAWGSYVASCTAGEYRDAVLADDPVAYWSFTETSADDPAVNNGLLGQADIAHGTYSAGAKLNQPTLVAGEEGSLLTGPGSSMFTEEFEKFDDVFGFGGTGFSVEFWTAAQQVSTGFTNLVGDGTGGLDFNLMVYMGAGGFIRPHLQTEDLGYASIDSERQLEQGEIVHVVSTWDSDSGDFNLYLDGELADTFISAGEVPNDGTPAFGFNPIFVGQDGREPSPLAWIDEVAIYNYELDESRIATHYSLGQGAPSPETQLPDPFADPGDLDGLPDGLVTFIDFDEAAAPGDQGILDFAYDRASENNGSFQGAATRVPGLIGLGAASFDNTGGTQVALGPGVDDSFSAVEGITVEALIRPEWSGEVGDYDEIFRKEDGGNRILLSFQNDANGGGANPPVLEGPVLSFGLNVGGAYGELDMPLNEDLADLDGGNENSGTVWLESPGGELGPNDVVLNDGETHHVSATYDADTGEKQIWIDGVLRWSVEEFGDVTSGGAAVAYIGAVNGGENWTGVIDEFAFWNRALAASEIETHFANVQSGLNYFGIGSLDPCDFDGDGSLTVADIDLLRGEIMAGSGDLTYDVNADGTVDSGDIEFMVTSPDKLNTYVGDSNLDGQFSSTDLVDVFQAGKFETGQAASWAEGDWDGNGSFGTSDMVFAFQGGGYEQGVRTATQAVPEPTGFASVFLSLVGIATVRRRASQD